ncbi:RNA-directed DNA polymerase, eukaryota [Tanacetum coccineum]
MVSNASWNIPEAWFDLYPVLNQLTIPHLIPDRKDEILWRTSVGIERKFTVSAVWESIRPRGQEVEWFRVVCGIKSQGYVGFLKLGRLKGVQSYQGFEGLRLSSFARVLGFIKDSMEYKMKNVFGLRWNCRDREAEVFQVSNDDTAVAQRRLEDKQPEEKTNTDCLVKEQEKVHLGIKVGANITVTGVPEQEGAEGNVAGKKKVKESMKANLGKLLKYIDKVVLDSSFKKRSTIYVYVFMEMVSYEDYTFKFKRTKHGVEDVGYMANYCAQNVHSEAYVHQTYLVVSHLVGLELERELNSPWLKKNDIEELRLFDEMLHCNHVPVLVLLADNLMQFKLIKDLENLDAAVDRGEGKDEISCNRVDIINKLNVISNNQILEVSQKSKIRWAVEGDENSKFFHGMLNKKRSLLNVRGVLVDGIWVDNPHEVKNEFFEHFSSRFQHPGTKDATIVMDFPNVLSGADRQKIEGDVTNDEIKKAVWDCGTDKAPGPDGFTFGFFRRYWDLIMVDVTNAVRYFFTHCDIPKGCNSSFITLIPKNLNSKLVKDFRPISLIGCLYKIIAKIMANRLVCVIKGIVNEVQSAFIADRQILDGPFILNEVIQWCKLKKKHALIFKVDFEKAYDSVRWDFLDEILRKFGFGDKWCKWIQCCLQSSKGSILVNGSPTKEFEFGKGLKQGDPLSPFLFILVMESLHLSFQRVVDAGLFQGINIGEGLVNISHMFYADDAVFVGQWCDRNISTLVHVLECFHKVSGLRINMCKSKIMGVHVDEKLVRCAAKQLGCLTLNVPFSYLGSIVGGCMTRQQAWSDIVDRVKKRLSKWKMQMLSIGGRLTLAKSVLGSLPLFNFSIFKVPMCVLRDLEGIRRKFFNGHEQNGNKASWVNWKHVLKSKETGGLGVSSLYAINRGLLVKWIWRFFSQGNSLWARTIKAIHGSNGLIGTTLRKGYKSCWTSIIREMESLSKHGINVMQYMHIKLGDGESSKFWYDNWCEDAKLRQVDLSQSFRRQPRGGIEQEQFEKIDNLVKLVTLDSSKARWNNYVPIKFNGARLESYTSSSLPTRSAAEVLGLTTTRQIWLSLEAAYSNASVERIHSLRDSLRQLTKGTSSVSDYGRRFKAICDYTTTISTFGFDACRSQQ